MVAVFKCNIMPNREVKCQVAEARTVGSPVQHATKIAGATAKPPPVKAVVKETAMSPTPPQTESERTELLGSLTTQQQQRTSARVIKKLKLEPTGDKDKRKRPDGSDEIPECDTPNKIDEKDLKFPTVKQRMPKALWSTDEKSLFFEALNEYGKDFDAITAYICAKMKKKGMADANLKTKTQVSHFYYRTWHKLSKHVHFDENVKKVAQELYALINYGELRKKLVSVNEKTCARLGEMVLGGSMVVRARGRNLRVRTPMCRALRQLNQITERACGSRVCSRAQAVLRARDAAAWARVQAAAHNPRAAVSLPLRTRLDAFIAALQKRWAGTRKRKSDKFLESIVSEDGHLKENVEEPVTEVDRTDCHLDLRTDSIIEQEQKLPKRPVLHVGPRPTAEIHIPNISPSEQLSSQKICFSSYLERISQARDKSSGAKIRTPKRQRKDSGTDIKESESKKFKLEEDPIKSFSIEETAIDGIELMAHYKHHQDDEEKPSTEDEKELKSDDVTGDEQRQQTEDEVDILDKDITEHLISDKDVLERDKYMSEREKDSFSEVEDDERCNKSESDNESDHGKKERKFRNLKVKFRIRPKKRGGVYAMVVDKDTDDNDLVKDDHCIKDDHGIKEVHYIKDDHGLKYDHNIKDDHVKDDHLKDEDSKPDFDVEMAVKQVKKGWSVYDAGDLTIGDLYLMFGNRSKLELDYWWAEPTPPLPKKTAEVVTPFIEKDRKNSDKVDKSGDKVDKSGDKVDKIGDKVDKIGDKVDKIGDKVDKISDKAEKCGDKDSSVEEEKRESDTDIFSPKNTYSQDSNDGMSGDDRKSEQLASPEHKSSTSGSFKLVNKLINRPDPPAGNQNGFSQLSDRLKRLLALVGNPHIAGSGTLARCNCGHVCNQRKPQAQQKQVPGPQPLLSATAVPKSEGTPVVFRHPTPIAPRRDNRIGQALDLSGLPPWKRGRPKNADRRVVVQRLLPLLPKLPPPANLIPVRIVPQTPPPPPKILPKPPPTSTNDLSMFYVLSESNGQFFFHDGDRKIPITPPTDLKSAADSIKKEDGVKTDVSLVEGPKGSEGVLEPKVEITVEQKTEAPSEGDSPDIANFLPSESMSLSPSRLLRDTDGWLDSSVQDFSLSSFLQHLEGRPQPDSAVESHLQSLLAESSVDYVAKFADLAAEVTDDQPLPNTDLT